MSMPVFDIVRPQSSLRFFGPIFAIPALVSAWLTIDGLVHLSGRMVLDGMFPVLVAGLCSLPIVIGLRRRRRSLETLRRTKPPGDLYVTRASIANRRAATTRRSQKRYFRQGELHLNSAGLSWSLAPGSSSLTKLSWDELSSVRMTPRGPAIASLKVATHSGDSFAWDAVDAPGLAEALQTISRSKGP
jgi:hypothetical protein